MSPAEALRKAINICGSEAELARRVGVTGQAVNQWDVAPHRRAIEIEKATGGQVSRHDLCPDLYPPEANEEGAEANDEVNVAGRAA